jgi:hypothetical protein
MKDSDPDKIRPGMSAKCEVILNRMQETLYIPIEAVFNKEGLRVAYVVDGEKFYERQLELEERNEYFVQILDGVEAGETVALEDPTLVEGQRLIFYVRKDDNLPKPPSTLTEEVLPETKEQKAADGEKPEGMKLKPEEGAGVERIKRKGMGRPGGPDGEEERPKVDERTAGRPKVEVVFELDGKRQTIHIPVSLTMIEKIEKEHPGARIITIDGIEFEEFKKKLKPTDYSSSAGDGNSRTIIYRR